MTEQNRPEWIKKFNQLGINSAWADPIFEKHRSKIIKNSNKAFAPIHFINFNISNIEEEPLQKIPSVDNVTKVESLLFILDILDAFGNNIPKSDKDIKKMYENIMDSSYFSVNTDLPEFYTHCRNMQYIDIKSTEFYHIINESYKKFVIQTDNNIKSNNYWIVPYKNSKIKIKTKGEVPVYEKDVLDPHIYCEVISIISQEKSEFTEGDYLSIPPKCFNKGIPIGQEPDD